MRIKKNCEGEGGEEAMGYRLQADRQAFRCLGVSDGGSVLISDLGIRNSKSGNGSQRSLRLSGKTKLTAESTEVLAAAAFFAKGMKAKDGRPYRRKNLLV